MTITHRILIAAITTGLTSATAFAAKSAELKPVLAKPGKATVDESFNADALGKQWSVAKGEWQVRDGSLTGKEKKEDKHPAVLTLAQPNHNSIIRFSFKLDGTEGLSLSFNYAKGHLFRINVAPDGVTVVTDKDKKDPKSKSEQLGKAEGKFDQGQWYTMFVEVQGTKVSVQTDNGVKISASHPSLDVDKTGYRFVMRGASLLLDDVKAWETQP
jgi:hypothetical protein